MQDLASGHFAQSFRSWSGQQGVDGSAAAIPSGMDIAATRFIPPCAAAAGAIRNAATARH
jgi:hypothetical protein